jgi:UDP-perosamine 4-acetyltransferase
MSSVLVLGTGGHARVCVEVLRASGHEVAGCVGHSPAGRLNADYLGEDDALPHLAQHATDAFVAIGDNSLRQQLVERARSNGLRLVSAVHPSAVLSPTAEIGPNVVAMAGVVLNAYARVDVGAIINTGASVDHDCHVGAFAHVAPGVRLAGNVTVGEGAFIGVGAAVIPGRQIGAWATVGAGAAVIRDVLPGDVVTGVPARPRTRDQR